MAGTVLFPHDQQELMRVPENAAVSPLSGDESAEMYVPSPRKSRRGANKRVVSVSIGDGDGSRGKGEVYPPPDSWSWRKYGQKPIKGSPYPRGYYRCSSSKGCPARKQVERNRQDPTILLITYSSEHNHPVPTTTKHHHPSSTTVTTTTSSSSTATTTTTATEAVPVAAPGKFAPEESAVFANQPDLETNSNSFNVLAGEPGWLSDYMGVAMLESPTFLDPAWNDANFAAVLPTREEDELFGDLGELPECSVVFRRCIVEAPCCNGTG